MDVDSPQLKAYLYKLYEMTHADPAAQVSMYEVGEALGVENDEAGQMAETLFMGGHAELKTLSGGIGITLMGMDALGVTPAVAPGLETPALGNEIVLTDPDRNHVDTLLGDIKSGMASAKAEYQVLETLVMDIKTIEVENAIERLKRLGLLMEENGQWVLTERSLTTSNDIPSRSLKTHHEQLLSKAIQSLYVDDVKERDITSMIVALDQSEMDEVKEAIKKFRRSFKKFSKQRNNRVYCLGIQMFPLSKGEL